MRPGAAVAGVSVFLARHQPRPLPVVGKRHRLGGRQASLTPSGLGGPPPSVLS